MRDDKFEAYAEALMAGDALAGIKAAEALGGIGVGTRYRAICRRKDGSVRWEGEAKNRVTTVGLNILWSSFANSPSAAWYLGLAGQSITDGAIGIGSSTFTSASNPWLAEDASQNIILRGAAASGNDLLTSIATFNSTGSVALTSGNASGLALTAVRSIWGCRVGDTMSSHSPWSNMSSISNATRPAFTFGTPASGSVSNTLSPAVFTINADNSYIGGFFMVDQNTVGGTTGTLYGMAVWTSGGFRQAYSGDTVTVTGTLTATSTNG